MKRFCLMSNAGQEWNFGMTVESFVLIPTQQRVSHVSDKKMFLCLKLQVPLRNQKSKRSRLMFHRREIQRIPRSPESFRFR
jgi:hypothetical protein